MTTSHEQLLETGRIAPLILKQYRASVVEQKSAYEAFKHVKWTSHILENYKELSRRLYAIESVMQELEDER